MPTQLIPHERPWISPSGCSVLTLPYHAGQEVNRQYRTQARRLFRLCKDKGTFKGQVMLYQYWCATALVVCCRLLASRGQLLVMWAKFGLAFQSLISLISFQHDGCSSNTRVGACCCQLSMLRCSCHPAPLGPCVGGWVPWVSNTLARVVPPSFL